MFVQTALPISNPLGFYDLNERQYYIPVSRSKPSMYTYTCYGSDRDEDFSFGIFTLKKNVKEIYTTSGGPNSSVVEYSNREITRQLPANPNETTRYSNGGTQVNYITSDTVTVTDQTCLLNYLKLGDTTYARSMNIRNRDFDFYCHLYNDGNYDVAKMKAFLFIAPDIFTMTGDTNYSPKKDQSIELNVTKVNEYQFAISGFIPSDSTFYESNLWTTTARLFLCIFVEGAQGFGCEGLTILAFPYGNADTWHKLWNSNYIPPLDSTLFNYYYNANVLDYINSAISYVSTSIYGLGFWFTPIGVMTSILPLSAILGLALLFIILEKFSV